MILSNPWKILLSPFVRGYQPLCMDGNKGGVSKKEVKSGGFKSDGDENDWTNYNFQSIKDAIGDKNHKNMMKHIHAERERTQPDDSSILAIVGGYVQKHCVTLPPDDSIDDELSDDELQEDSTWTSASGTWKTGWRKSIVDLSTTHTTSDTTVVLFARTSHGTHTLRSQIRRLNISYDILRLDEYDGRSFLCFPVVVVGREIEVSALRYNEYGSKAYEWHFDSLCQLVTGLVDGGKKVIISMIDIFRLHREPTVALEMVNRLEGLGDVKVKPMKTFDYENETVLGMVTEKIAAKPSGKCATHLDAAFGLRNDKDPPLQRNLNDAYNRYVSEKGLPDQVITNKFVAQACADGDAIVGHFNSDYVDKEWSFLKELRVDNPDPKRVKEAATTFIDGYRDNILYKSGEKNKCITFQRYSPGQNDPLFLEINGKKHPESQLIKNLIYMDQHIVEIPVLSALSDDKRKTASPKPQLNVSVITAKESQKRRKHVIKEVIAIAELIAKGEVHSLLATITTRLSGYEGYILFLQAICEKTGTDFILTECIGIDIADIAKAEGNRVKGLEESVIKTMGKRFKPKTDIGNGMYKYASEDATQEQDADTRNADTRKKSRKGQKI